MVVKKGRPSTVQVTACNAGRDGSWFWVIAHRDVRHVEAPLVTYLRVKSTETWGHPARRLPVITNKTSRGSTGHLPEGEIDRNMGPSCPAFTCNHQ